MKVTFRKELDKVLPWIFNIEFEADELTQRKSKLAILHKLSLLRKIIKIIIQPFPKQMIFY